MSLNLDTQICWDSSLPTVGNDTTFMIIEEGIANLEERRNFSTTFTPHCTMWSSVVSSSISHFEDDAQLPYTTTVTNTYCLFCSSFIRREARRDRLFEEFQVEDLNNVVDHEGVGDS